MRTNVNTIIKQSKEEDAFEFSDKHQVHIGDVLKFQQDSIKAVLTIPTLKNKYVRFEIEKGHFTHTVHKLIGVYFQEKKEGDKEDKVMKEIVLATTNSANNFIFELIMPMLKAIAFDNLNLYITDRKKYFSK